MLFLFLCFFFCFSKKKDLWKRSPRKQLEYMLQHTHTTKEKFRNNKFEKKLFFLFFFLSLFSHFELFCLKKKIEEKKKEKEKKNEGEVCKIHNGSLQYFCQTCKEAVCSDCAMFGKKVFFFFLLFFFFLRHFFLLLLFFSLKAFCQEGENNKHKKKWGGRVPRKKKQRRLFLRPKKESKKRNIKIEKKKKTKPKGEKRKAKMQKQFWLLVYKKKCVELFKVFFAVLSIFKTSCHQKLLFCSSKNFSNSKRDFLNSV